MLGDDNSNTMVINQYFLCQGIAGLLIIYMFLKLRNQTIVISVKLDVKENMPWGYYLVCWGMQELLA